MTNTQASVSTGSPVVEQIRTGSESAVEELYKSLRSIHFFFKREIWRDRALGGHQKTGHRRSPQNRPTGRGQDLTLLYRVGGRRGKKFLICVAESWHSGYTGFAWAEDSGNAGMRPERRPRCRNGGAASSRPRS